MPSNSTSEWLAKAAEDEQVVGAIRQAGGPWSMAAYHLQQAAEKYIKAVLVESGVAPPKTHDLPRLLSLIPGLGPTPDVQIAAAVTSPFAWLTRYPGSPSIDESHVAQVESSVAMIRTWALGRIP